MDLSCRDHLLTEEERLEFEENGFFVLEEVLPAETITGLIEAVDCLDASLRPERGLGADERMTVRDILGRDDRFLELVDWPLTLPKVWGILDWNIQIYHSVSAVSPAGQTTGHAEPLGWHQDSGRLNQELEGDPRPRVSLKVAFFLTDCSRPDSANLRVVPGSHLCNDVPRSEGDPDGAIDILVPAGGAVVFDRRLWHAATANASDIARKALFYGYSYRWLRPRDDQTVEHVMARCDAIRRQLLGASPSGGYGYTSPTDEDVPLRTWLRENAADLAT